MATTIWENLTDRKAPKKKQKHCPGPGWTIATATFKLKCNTKCLVQCSGCGNTRSVLESTRDAWDFSDLCITCKRLEAKMAREAKAKLRPERRCLKCDELFQPTLSRRFLCERCVDINQNPRNRLTVEPGWECFG
jgi:hypothetical protein